MPFKIPKKIWLEHMGEEIVKTVRLAATVNGLSLLVFFILEQFKSGLISNTVNINLLVLAEIILLMIILFFGQRFARVKPKRRWLAVAVLLCLMVCVFVVLLAGSGSLTVVLMAMLATVIAYIVWYSYVYES